MQFKQKMITSLFQADKLWAKGFSGAKVRMAVFDTGVRADHPHFRNIKVHGPPFAVMQHCACAVL